MYCPTCPNEKCVHLSTNKNSNFYDYKNFKSCSHVLNIPVQDQNPQLCCLVLLVQIALHEGRVITTKKKKHLRFWKMLSANHNQAHPNLRQRGKNQSIYRISVSVSHWLIQLTKNHLHSHFIHFQSTVKQHNFLSLQRWYWVVSRLWARFRYSDCQRSGPRNNNQFSRNSSGSLELVAISKTRLSQQPSSASSNYPQPGRDYGDDGRSAPKCRCARYGHKRALGVRSGRFWILLGEMINWM